MAHNAACKIRGYRRLQAWQAVRAGLWSQLMLFSSTRKLIAGFRVLCPVCCADFCTVATPKSKVPNVKLGHFVRIVGIPTAKC
jgi:hypothetical protein